MSRRKIDEPVFEIKKTALQSAPKALHFLSKVEHFNYI